MVIFGVLDLGGKKCLSSFLSLMRASEKMDGF
jgi:hypothetical protein